MSIYLKRVLVSYRRPVASLLRANGTEYPVGTIVNKIHIPHERSIAEVVERADNSRAFTEMGRRVGKITKMTVDAFSEAAVAAIMADLTRAATDGIFMLERPPLRRGQKAYRHWIRFYAAEFAPVQEVRSSSRIQWHRAEITDIDVLRTRRF